jgi:hypothetical protein
VVKYWLGADFGQASDFTAVAVLERVPIEVGEREVVRKTGLLRREKVRVPTHDHQLHLRYLSRPPLRTSYERIADGIVSRLRELEPTGAFGERGTIGLVVDATGVGRAVVDMLTERLSVAVGGPKVHLWPVTVTAGQHVTRNGPFMGVPKRELIHAGVVALQEGRLKIGADVPEREQLMEELLAYRIKINLQTGHDSYQPWREGGHDDLLFALCLATWAWGYTKRSYEEHAIAPPRSA